MVPLDRSALEVPDVGCSGRKFKAFCHSRQSTAGRPQYQWQKQTDSKRWCIKHEPERFGWTVNYHFFAETWDAATACLNQREGNTMQMRASHLHTTNRVQRWRQHFGKIPLPGSNQNHRWKSIRGNDIYWTTALRGGVNSKTNTFRRACGQTTVQSTMIQQLCTNSDGAKELFWFKPCGTHLRGNLWHQFPGPGFDVQIGTVQSLFDVKLQQKMWHRGRIPNPGN